MDTGIKNVNISSLKIGSDVAVPEITVDQAGFDDSSV